MKLLVLGCSSGFVGAVGEAAAVYVVVVRSRDGIDLQKHIRNLAEREVSRGSMALGWRVVLSRLSGLILVRRSEKLAAVLVMPCSALASWSCTGLVVAGEEAGYCVQRLVQQQADLCIVVEVVCFAAAASVTSHSTACSNRLAAD